MRCASVTIDHRLKISLDQFNQIGRDFLPGLLGVEFLEAETGRMVSRLDVEQRHHAPNGYLHAATVVALADTACGYGCRLSLPEDATGCRKSASRISISSFIAAASGSRRRGGWSRR